VPATDTVRQELRSYIEENFLYMHPDVELTDDEDMLDKGVIDSLGFVEIVEQIQRQYSIEVRDIEITEQNFGSINAIAQFVSAKQEAS
jgi:acyl carrier protein